MINQVCQIEEDKRASLSKSITKSALFQHLKEILDYFYLQYSTLIENRDQKCVKSMIRTN